MTCPCCADGFASRYFGDCPYCGASNLAQREAERLEDQLHRETKICESLSVEPFSEWGENLRYAFDEGRKYGFALAAAASGGDVKQAPGEAPQSGPKGNAQPPSPNQAD